MKTKSDSDNLRFLGCFFEAGCGQKTLHMLWLRIFYLLKPLIPRKIQILLRRRRARAIWRRVGRNCLPQNYVAEKPVRWPEPYLAAAIVTHDVETDVGQANIDALRKIESSYGVTSCWNFVVKRYQVDQALVRQLANNGHEIGVHGLYHDGKEFSSPRVFKERWKAIERAAREWGARGFRSPSLLYDEALLKTIGMSWDSSMPSWDPFQPGSPGCGRFFPFMLNEQCVELPVSLWQDFTLFEELEFRSISVWRKQIDFVYESHGLITVIVHPDYMLSEERLGYFRELLEYLLAKDRLWMTTPAQIADWVRGVSISPKKDWRPIANPSPQQNRMFQNTESCSPVNGRRFGGSLATLRKPWRALHGQK